MQGVAQAQPQYEITEADKARQAQIARAWQAFDDNLEPSLIPMEDEDPELANAEDNIVSSSMRTIIRFLFGKELSITVEKNAPPEAQKVIDATFGRKEKRMPLLQKLAQNGLLSGQAFLRIVPYDYGRLGSKDVSFRLIALDPATVFAQTAPHDCETVQLYCIEYASDEMINGNPRKRYYREEIRLVAEGAAWEIQHWTRLGDKGPWEAAIDPGTGKMGEPYRWPYSYCPIQSCQNIIRANSFWGDPDTTKGLIRLNKIINFVLSNINKGGKLYAQPWPWVTGARMPPIEVGKALELPVEATIGALEFHPDLAGQVLFLDRLRDISERLTSVPPLVAGMTRDMPGGNISGIALETMCIALLNEVEDKHNTYGELIIDTCKAIFELMNMSTKIDIELGWQNPLPVNKKESWEQAILQQQAGVSKTTILRERGYDPEAEAELNQQEAEQAMTAFSRGQGMPPPSMQAGQQGEQE
jgi:hypothetical protein